MSDDERPKVETTYPRVIGAMVGLVTVHDGLVWYRARCIIRVWPPGEHAIVLLTDGSCGEARHQTIDVLNALELADRSDVR